MITFIIIWRIGVMLCQQYQHRASTGSVAAYRADNDNHHQHNNAANV